MNLATNLMLLRGMTMLSLSIALSGFLNTSAAGANDGKPRASYLFRPTSTGIVPDENGKEHPATVKMEDTDGWMDTDEGPAVELKNEKDRIDLTPDVFPGLRGAVRIKFRPSSEGNKSQLLFRVYGKKDGLTLYLRDGALNFRYFNRAQNANVSASLPAGIVSIGGWTTATASWDLEKERRILLQVDEKRKNARTVPPDTHADFTPGSQVIVGNEHAGGSPFLGAIHSVQIFDSPFWEQAGMAALDEKPVPAELPKVARERVLPRTLFFSRSQPKYNLFSNTLLRRWVDRPLFFDRRTEESSKPFSILTSASFLKTQESLRAYGLDGFGSLLASLPFQGTVFQEMLDSADAHPDQCVPLVMEVGGGDSEESAQKCREMFLPLAERALHSPNVLRVNGKILVLSYALDGSPLEHWIALRNAMRERFGNKFIFIADMTTRRPALLREFQELKGVRASTLESFRQHLRAWLEASDGIMWAGGSHTNQPDGTLDRAFYRDFLIPVFNGILNETPYRRKLFGLDAEVGYINVMSSRRINPEEGTRRLRDNFEIALEAAPDFITMPEWDELNENTSIGPTLTNSLSTQRIVRHYIERFAGQPNQPIPGDDPAIPNLVLSFLPYIKLGEPLEIEVLSLPDSTIAGKIEVELSLKNLLGKVVQTFKSVTLSAERIGDHVFTLPSEVLTAEPVLIPSLKVTAADGRISHWEDGLEAIRLLPTWNLNYKATKMPLRDLLQPKNATFQLAANQPAEGVTVDGSIACDEPIASVEVVQDSRELYAIDPKNELTPGPGEALVMLQWQAMRNPKHFSGTIEVKQGELRRFVDWTRPDYKPASYRLAAMPDAKGRQSIAFATDQGVNSTNARGGFFLISNPEEALLSLKTNAFTVDFPVKEILASGKIAKVFSGGLTLEAQRLEMLPQVPFPLLKKEATFTTTLQPWRKDTPLQMRVVTVSGKIYRSRPILPYPESKDEQCLPIWSESRNEPVRVSVSASRIPDIIAEMTPRHGASVHTSDSHYFYGLAGGLPFDMAAFAKRRLADSYPSGSNHTAPDWVQEDGVSCLKFNGIGNFLYFPEETLPRGSFTLEFEIKPTNTKPQILCTSRGYHRGALTLTLINGVLNGQWIDRKNKITPIQTGLALPKGEWSRVSLVYDLNQLRITVNGESVSTPTPDGATQVITPFIFGGYGNGKDFAYYSGFLKSIRFRHTGSLQNLNTITRIKAQAHFQLASCAEKR